MDTYLPETAPFPNADATEQFSVTTNFDARYGLRSRRRGQHQDSVRR